MTGLQAVSQVSRFDLLFRKGQNTFLKNEEAVLRQGNLQYLADLGEALRLFPGVSAAIVATPRAWSG